MYLYSRSIGSDALCCLLSVHHTYSHIVKVDENAQEQGRKEGLSVSERNTIYLVGEVLKKNNVSNVSFIYACCYTIT